MDSLVTEYKFFGRSLLFNPAMLIFLLKEAIFMRLIIIILLLIITSFFLCSPLAASQDKAEHLFFIERSKNRNLVQYDVRLTGNRDLPDSNPVTAYWILQDGRREKLSSVEEELAYGIASQEKIEKNKFRIHLVAFKNREIIVEKIKGSFKAVVSINGKESILQKVYVGSKEGPAGKPQVFYVDLFGRVIRTNLPARERIISGHG